MYIKVKNLHNTSDHDVPSGYSSWLDYWEKHMKMRSHYCSNRICVKLSSVGAHVKKVDSNDNHWYIVPLCYACNNSYNNDEFYVEEAMLVPVNL